MTKEQKQQFENMMVELRASLEPRFAMAMVSVASIPSGEVLESLTLSTSVTAKRMKKDTAGAMTVEVKADHKIVTEKRTGTAIFGEDRQFTFMFDGHGNAGLSAAK